MREVFRTAAFKRDYRRVLRGSHGMHIRGALSRVVELLAGDRPLPAQLRRSSAQRLVARLSEVPLAPGSVVDLRQSGRLHAATRSFGFARAVVRLLTALGSFHHRGHPAMPGNAALVALRVRAASRSSTPSPDPASAGVPRRPCNMMATFAACRAEGGQSFQAGRRPCNMMAAFTAGAVRGSEGSSSGQAPPMCLVPLASHPVRAGEPACP